MESRRSFLKKSGLLVTISGLPIAGIAQLVSTDKRADRVIRLYVDTSRIVKENINAYCNFRQPSGVSNEDFTITANVGDTIIWEGVSTSAPDKDIVNITAINHEGGRNIFNQNVLIGNGETPERVIGKVLRTTVNESDYKYKMLFTVFNNGVRRNGIFHIDPKIQVH